jgi:hypothetical protein
MKSWLVFLALIAPVSFAQGSQRDFICSVLGKEASGSLCFVVATVLVAAVMGASRNSLPFSYIRS